MQWKGKVEDVAITHGTTDTLVTILIREGAEFLKAEVANSAHSAFDAFIVETRPHPDASYHIKANATSDFVSSMQWPILGCDADLTGLAKSGKAEIDMEVKGLNAVRFKASATASSDTTASVYWQVR
jgi:hypothetical protein